MILKRMLILFAFTPFFLNAQTFYKAGSFVIKGQVKNFKEPFFEFGQTSYLNNTSQTVKVQPNGNFEQQFPVQNRQDIYLYLNDDAITFTVQDKDTINVYWDETSFASTFSIKGNNEVRTKDLERQLKLYYGFRKPVEELNRILYQDNNSTYDEKYTTINDLFIRNVEEAVNSGDPQSENFNYLLIQLYFKYSNILRTHGLIPKYTLKFHSDSTHPSPYPPFINYTTLNENWFWNVPEYRDFIYDYVRFNRPFYAYVPFENNPAKPFNPTLDEYHLALANFYFNNIKEWFITQSIISGFGNYNFIDVENVYKQAANTITSPYLKDTLQKFYAAIKHLRPGNPAPGFSLKNEQGKLVSLSDFKGKVVYIDFWGVTCGPCIYEIKNAVPQLHEHYKSKDVVFINICVDSDEKEWKTALEKYKLDGVNLRTEGWDNDPTCKAYNINAIPHYVLIDKSGKLSNNNGPRASMVDLGSGKNEFDLLLK